MLCVLAKRNLKEFFLCVIKPDIHHVHPTIFCLCVFFKMDYVVMILILFLSIFFYHHFTS